ncbi:MAG: GAF domain-containing protein [bacterium]|nr:GAF domain-containing protein [Candidatus Kapabacteria bacterium]
MAIALLGVAIALFLDDSVIRLIGVCVALLGGAALYMTLRQRLEDQVQVHTRRTTLPPPAFKTRTTTDPGSSTKRIHFDDFQDTFDTDVESDATSIRTTSSEPIERVEFRAEKPAQRSTGARGDSDNDVEFAGGDDGSFRVVRTTAADNGDDAQAPARSERPQANHPAVPPAAPPSSQSSSASTPRTESPQPSAAKPESGREDKPRWEKRAEKRNERRMEVQTTTSTSVFADDDGDTDTAIAEPPVIVEAERDATMSRRQVQMILDDLASDDHDDTNASEPRAEFVRLVSQVLNAVARSISARSIVFCWVNLQKRHIIPEAHLTTGICEVKSGLRLPIGNDVISQIAESGIPEILTDIGPAAEAELISYYMAPANTRSFVGVPVFFRREVVGVLAADSSELNAFDESSVATLAEYTRLITGLIRGYTEKYDLQLSARTLEAFERMQNAFAGAALSPNQVARVLADQIGQLFDHQYIAIVLFDDNVREWRIAASYSAHADRHVDGLRPEMNNSLVGYVTRNAEESYLSAVDREVLFSAEESFARGGSFIAIPLVGTMRCYGALAVAHSAPSAYIPRDTDLLRDLARFAAMAIEVYNVNHAIDSQSVHDEVTGAYNAEFLASLLARESGRARDYRKPLSYALVSIDIPSSLRDAMSRELEDVIASSVGAAITSLVRTYDIVGRIDTGTFGVVLVERNDQESYLWAEKLRKDVAGRILTHGARKFSVTVSIGICDQTDLSGSESIVSGARTALERARSGDGNAVILY